MEWLGWLLAGVAIGVAVWLWRLLAAEHARGSELLYAKMDADNRGEALQAELAAQAGKVDAARVFVDVADRLDARLMPVCAQLERADGDLADYREHVRRFDAAVQYCLQPVELIFGADKASLDQLVHHVEGARRKLFEARTLLENHPLHGGAAALEGALVEVRKLTAYAGELRNGELMPPATRDEALGAPTAADAAAA